MSLRRLSRLPVPGQFLVILVVVVPAATKGTPSNSVTAFRLSHLPVQGQVFFILIVVGPAAKKRGSTLNLELIALTVQQKGMIKLSRCFVPGQLLMGLIVSDPCSSRQYMSLRFKLFSPGSLTLCLLRVAGALILGNS